MTPKSSRDLPGPEPKKNTARDDEKAPLEHATRELHLDDRLRADLGPERRRQVQPLVLKLRRKRGRIENLKQAGDVHVLGQKLGGRARRISRDACRTAAKQKGGADENWSCEK